ncbi:MAG: ribulose-phosphate 3-epimerase [Candidatus Aenigmarchaeota archaeon]|nr:ribulose-phosphate 3-epimerase [Candidatus Aenigmarchaeota archaeon]
MVKISPSVLSADFGCLKESLKPVKEAEWLHIDVMDGHFAPNITIGPFVVKALRNITNQFLDVHLMIENPEKYIEAFADAGSDLITVHAEACKNLEKIIDMIRKKGKRVGISINPKTPVSKIKKLLHKIDVVLVMSVEPGFSGQKFMPKSLDKVKELKKIKKEKGFDYEIEIDGGISRDNCAEVAKAGADVLVSGSAIFKSGDPAGEIREFRKRCQI